MSRNAQPLVEPAGESLGPADVARLIPSWPGAGLLVPGICTVYRVGSTVQVWALGAMIGQQQLSRGRPVGDFVLAAPILEIVNSRVDLWTGEIQDRRTKRPARRVKADAAGEARRSRR